MSAVPAPGVRGPMTLSDRQSCGLNRFLLGGTGRVLHAIETMLELEIEKSESLMEIAPANESQFLRRIGDRSLYAISSNLAGDMQGRLCLLVESGDVQRLADLMIPVLTLLFLSGSDADLQTLERNRPHWMSAQGELSLQDAEFQAQMVDLLGELGNVLFGSYSRTLYEYSALTARHSIPRVGGDTTWQDLLLAHDALGLQQQPGIIIEHQLHIGGRPVQLWCLISLEPDSFRKLLGRFEACDEGQAAVPPIHAFAAQTVSA